MSVLLFLIPLFAVLSGFSIYRHNGRWEFLRLDLIQFVYMFLIAPLFLIWAKTFIFFLLRAEVGDSLSVGELYTIDTAFTLLLFYMYAFVVMHALTKTFRLNAEKDPSYDLYQHSEYIHLWLTHVVTAIGAMVSVMVLALLNVFFPLMISMSRYVFYLVCLGGVVFGCVAFAALWLTDPRQDGRRYMRIMKLTIGIAFSILASVYFLIDPKFDSRYGLYWFIFLAFSTMLVWAFFTYRSGRVNQLFARVAEAHKDTQMWGVNPQLFTSMEKPKAKG